MAQGSCSLVLHIFLLLYCSGEIQAQTGSEILLHPEDTVTVTAGEGVTLTCVVYGSPMPDVSWFRNGDQRIDNFTDNAILYETLIEQSNMSFVHSTLELCPVSLADAGEYSCHTNNTHGNQTVVFQVDVTQENTSIFESPVDRTADISETVSFVCSASGIPLPDISWYKDGSLLDNVTNNITETFNGTYSITSVLVLDNLVLSSAGEYSCNAFNDFSGSDSRTFTFTVESQVRVLLYPEDNTTTTSDSIVFACIATGVPPPDIIWLKDSVQLSNELSNITESRFSNDSGYFTLSVLTLCDLELPDSGQYSCMASNNISTGQVTDSRDFTLEVQAPPTITMPPVNQTVSQSADVELSCVVSGVPLAQVEWLRDTEEGLIAVTSDDPSVQINTTDSDMEVTSTLILSSIELSQSGAYICSANNSLGIDMALAYITVHIAATLLVYPGETRIEVDRSVSLTCVAMGHPLPSLTWLKDGVPLSSGDSFNITNTELSGTDSVTSILDICNIELSDTGLYGCEASNSLLADSLLEFQDSVQFNLSVLSVPLFTLERLAEQLLIAAGDVISLSCAAAGNPRPVLNWTKDGEQLASQSLLAISDSVVDSYNVESSLTIGPVEPIVMGSYRCSAEGFTADGQSITIHSNTTQFQFTSPPDLLSVSTDQALFSTASVTLSCTFEGVPLPTVSWTYLEVDGTTPTTLEPSEKYTFTNETEIGGVYSNITSTLTLSTISLDDAGQYTCTANNEVVNLIGAQSNGSSQLYFQEDDPSFVEEPESRVVIAGTTAILRCAVASSSSFVNIVWTKDGEDFVPTSPIEQGVGVFRRDLEFPNVATSDSGNYVCTASSDIRVISSGSVFLNVFTPAMIVDSPANTTANLSETVSFSCLVRASHEITLSWSRVGQQDVLMSDLRVTVTSRELNETFHSLTLEFSAVQLSDSGVYTCNANNQLLPDGTEPSGSDVSQQFELFVQRAPVVQPVGTSVQVAVDEMLEQSIQFEIMNADPLVLEDDITPSFVLYDGNVSSFNFSKENLTFLISPVDIYENEGSYSVAVSNPAGISSSSVYLNVQSRPVALQLLVSGAVNDSNRMSYVAIEADTVSFTCSFLADPTPSITWMLNSMEINTEDTQYVVTTDDQDLGSIRSITQQLTIESVVRGDTGTYTCNVSNMHGSAQEEQNLAVLVPPTVTPTEEELIGVEHRDNTSSDITVSFTITRAFPAVEVQDIVWSYTLTRGPMNSTEMDVLTLAMNSSKYSLSADRRSLIIYDVDFFDAGYFTVNATNEAGTGTATQELIVHVEPELLDTSYDVTNETVENDTVSFSCVADGYPLPNIIWLHNNSFIPVAVSTRHAVSVSTVASSNRPHIPEATNSTLTVSRLRLRDTGEYLCRVDPSNRDRGRSDISGPFEMTVSPAPINYCQPDPCQNGGVCSNQTASYLCTCDPTKWRGVNCTIEVVEFEPPTITEQPDLDSFPELSRRVTLTCGVFGIPEPNITWFKDGVVLEGERSNNLVIVEVELVDRGRYKCTAENFDPNKDRSATFSDESSEAVVNIKGIAQYNMTVQFEQKRRRRRQNVDQNLKLAIDEFSQSLSGVELSSNVTVLSVTTEETTAEENATQASLLITLLAPEGGSQELTEELDELVSETAQEVGLVISEPPMRFDGCVAERTVLPPLEEGGLEVVLMWPESDLGETVVLQCPCGNLSALTNNTIDRNASRTCGGSFSEGAVWESPLDMPCNFSSATRRLCLVANLIEEPEKALGELDNITSNEEDIGVDELGVTIILLEAISVGAEQDAMLTEDLFGVVDNLLVVNVMDLQMSQEEANTSARILNLVESVAQFVPVPENETSLVFRQESFAVAVMDLNPDPNAFEGQDFSINIGDSGTIGEDAISLEGSQAATASLSIPNNTLLRTIMIPSGGVNMSARIPRITNAAYLNDALFVRREERNDSEVGSIIVAASLSLFSEEGVEDVRVTDLDPPIRLVFVKSPAFENGSNVSCNFWDFAADGGFGDWSSENCEVAEENDTIIVCECTHFTNFAILLDPNPVEVDIPPGVGQFLSAVSFIGAGISIICLILTVLTYVSSKKLRTSEAGQLLMHLSFGLLGIYVMFIICFLMADDKVPDALCAIAGGLLHYFLLVTFFLMAAEAINLYTKLVIVIGVRDFIKNRYVLKAGLISWIVPLFIVILSEAPDWTNYLEEEFCRPYGPPFWGGLVVPFGIIYILNWVLFIIIFISLLRKNFTKNKLSSDKSSSMSKLRQQFLVALMLSLLFGLGWGVGLVATTSIPVLAISLTLQIIFILLTSFQGLLLFIMNCVRSAEARNEWKRWVDAVTCHRVTFKDRKKLRLTSTSGEYTSRSKGTGTMSTATTSGTDTNLRAVKKDMVSSTLASESVFASSALETVEEEKRDLSLDKEEKVRYELLPHHEDRDSQNSAEENDQSSEGASNKTSQPEQLDLTFLNPAFDIEVVNPTSPSVKPEQKQQQQQKKEQDHFDVVMLDEFGFPGSPTSPAAKFPFEVQLDLERKGKGDESGVTEITDTSFTVFANLSPEPEEKSA